MVIDGPTVVEANTSVNVCIRLFESGELESQASLILSTRDDTAEGIANSILGSLNVT